MLQSLIASILEYAVAFCCGLQRHNQVLVLH
jgi:hypothetical protein